MSPKVTKSKRSLHWCGSISKKNTCAFFITVSVKKLLHYRARCLLQYRAFLLHYRALITLSGVFITLSGSNYSIGRLLHYRLVHQVRRESLAIQYSHADYDLGISHTTTHSSKLASRCSSLFQNWFLMGT